MAYNLNHFKALNVTELWQIRRVKNPAILNQVLTNPEFANINIEKDKDFYSFFKMLYANKIFVTQAGFFFDSIAFSGAMDLLPQGLEKAENISEIQYFTKTKNLSSKKFVIKNNVPVTIYYPHDLLTFEIKKITLFHYLQEHVIVPDMTDSEGPK